MKSREAWEQRIAQEFQRPFFSGWDREFFLILALSLVFEIILVVILSRQPVTTYSEKDIVRIQERFANFILTEEDAHDEGPSGALSRDAGGAEAEEAAEGAGEEESPASGQAVEQGTGDAAGEGAGPSRLLDRTEAAEGRRRAREAVSREVSNKGLLGLLTGTGSAASGESVSGLFSGSGESGVGGDLDEVLSSVSGLKTQGAGLSGSGNGNGGGSGVRGGRSGRKAGIDDLVSDLDEAGSSAVSRSGELALDAPTELEGGGRKSIYRSADAIQEVLLDHNSAIRYCYERELKRNPGLKGKLTVRITVAPNGHVTRAEIVESSLNNDRVERCILARIRLWKDFPPIDADEGDVTFRQVYAFGY